MRKIAILNFKGGTGKTTTAVNLSHALALSGKDRDLVLTKLLELFAAREQGSTGGKAINE